MISWHILSNFFLLIYIHFTLLLLLLCSRAYIIIIGRWKWFHRRNFSSFFSTFDEFYYKFMWHNFYLLSIPKLNFTRPNPKLNEFQCVAAMSLSRLLVNILLLIGICALPHIQKKISFCLLNIHSTTLYTIFYRFHFDFHFVCKLNNQTKPKLM